MDAVVFIKERDRMCGSFEGCEECPAFDTTANKIRGFCAVGRESKMDAADQIALVEKWSLAHPYKTRQDLFLEQYPEARMGDDGVLHVDPCAISASHRNAHGSCATMARACTECRREFWLHRVNGKENNNG